MVINLFKYVAYFQIKQKYVGQLNHIFLGLFVLFLLVRIETTSNGSYDIYAEASSGFKVRQERQLPRNPLSD